VTSSDHKKLDPFLYIGDDEYNELGSRPRYSLKNITERAHEMRKFLLDIRSGVPDAQTTYETFMRITKAAVEEHMKVCTLFLVQNCHC
jgi:hypothetical protein